MNFDKISFTLYDFIGYLLPGTIFLMTMSIIESTFSNSHLLTLQGIKSNLAPLAIVTYFAGQLCHVTGSTLKNWLNAHAKRCRQRLQTSPPASPKSRLLTRWLRIVEPRGSVTESAIKEEIESELCAAYSLLPDQLGTAGEARDFSCYALADNYVLAAGITGEREIFQAREGFFKASFAAFVFASSILALSLIPGGVVINQTLQESIKIARPASLLWSVLCLIAANICWHRQAYFSCLKTNHVKLLFFALRRAEPR